MKKCIWEECTNDTTNPKFCSLSCGAKHQQKYLTKKWSGTNVCEQCSRPFQVNSKTRVKRFCSRSCSATWNNSAKTNIKCLNCDKKLLYGLKYCSQSCGHEYRYQQFISEWLSGAIEITSNYGINSRIKKFLLIESGYKCSSETCCVPGGWAEVNPKSGKSPLTIDHIDGDASNNKRENLRVLCPNCHSLTETYCALNTGNGRTWRRDRERRIAGVA